MTCRRHSPALLVIVGIVSQCDCHSAEKIDRWPCPADGIIRAETGLCECGVDDNSFYVSGWGKPCARCNAQDGNGDTCFCDDGTLMRVDEAVCMDCPVTCDDIECVPGGCGLQCDALAGCAEGSTCSADASCVECEPAMCGGTCGDCPLGEVCVEGTCERGLLCCLDDNTGRICSLRADFCILPPVFEPKPGARCRCNARDSDKAIARCDQSFPGTVVAPGATCG